MTHILHYQEWESNGKWLCCDTSSFVNKSATWWYVPALLGITPVEYVILLKDKFHATYIHYEVKYDVFIFSFNTLEECRKFKNYINKIAREKKFYIY